MIENIEKKSLKQLERIGEELEEIKERTNNPRWSFLLGIMQGAGAIVGGILAITLIGWMLSALGVIPGFGSIADYLHSLLDKLPSKP